jgi:wyosine [tRNA(Phe)-imidazoG37] synthetase (radical SAM superfamily)
MIIFGPIPSRRLGRSLGINNIPPKSCSYSCVYCQVGRTTSMRVQRGIFFEPEEIVHAVQEKVALTLEAGESMDYLTFVPDGEPTLDLNLGSEIELLRPLGIQIAVICNSSLVWREDVRNDLALADWVSLKVDSVRADAWRQVDRPHGSLRLDAILDGVRAFAEDFEGTLVTETMLVRDVNDDQAGLSELAHFLSQVQPSVAYLSIPTRPPAEAWVRAPDEATINRAYQVLADRLDGVECLIGYEGNAFAHSGDVVADLLSITAVHPMRRDAVDALLHKSNADWPVVNRLFASGQLIKTMYEGREFYARSLPRRAQ